MAPLAVMKNRRPSIAPSCSRASRKPKSFPKLRPLRRICQASIAVLALPAAIWAGSFFWTGDNDNAWNTTTGANGTNWSSLSGSNSGTLGVPGSGDDVFFNVQGASNLNTVLGGDFSVRSVTFTSDATNPVTVGGANTLTLGSGGFTNNTNATIAVSTNVVLGASQTWTNNSTVSPLTVSGVVSGSSSNTLRVAGSGVVTLTNANTYAGSTSIFTGTLTLSNNGSLVNTSSVTLGAGTTLNLDSSSGANNNNRIGDSVGITSNGGFINLLGNGSVNTSETVGTLTTGSGATYVTVTPSGTQSATLTLGAAGTIASISHSVGGTVTFSSTGTVLAPNQTLVNTSVPANAIIGGFATIGTVTSTSSNTLDWATINGSGQIVPLGAYQNLTTSPTATDNAKADFSSGQITFGQTQNATVNTLYITGNSGAGDALNDHSQVEWATTDVHNVSATGRLTIVSGGIISNNAGGTGHYDNKSDIPNMGFIGPNTPNPVDNNLNYQGQITSNYFPTATTAELDVFTTLTGSLRIASIISDPDGTHKLTLVKSGPGVLDLSNGNTQSKKSDMTFTGKVVINEGILLINSTSSNANNLGHAPAASDDVTFNGGELRTYAGLTPPTTQGWTVGTRGGIFTYSGGGNSLIDNKITGVGGFSYYARQAGGGGGATIHVGNNNLGTNASDSDYQGPTNFWFSYEDGNDGTGSNGAPLFGAAANSTENIRFDDNGGTPVARNNQVPATSAVTLNMIKDDTAHTVVANTTHTGLDMFGSTQSFGSIAGNVDLKNHNGSLTIGANNLSTVYAGWIYGANTTTAGNGSLTKVGSGTQTLSGTYLYNGPTAVNGGTLLIGSGTSTTSTATLNNTAVTVGNGTLTGALGGNGTINGAVTVTSTGHLAPAMTNSNTNTLTINNNLTINNGGTLDFNFGSPGAGVPGVSDTVNITGSGNFSLSGGSDVLNINQINGSFGVGTYALITVTGGGTFEDNAAFTINGSTLFNYSILDPGDMIDSLAGGGVVPTGQLWLEVLPGNPNFFWTGAQNGIWNVNLTPNWTGANVKFSTGGNVTFDDANLVPGGPTTVSIVAGGILANSVTLNNSAIDYTIGGGALTISAGAGLVKNQAGGVTFNNTVNTQLTTVSAGTLTIGPTATLNSPLVKVTGGTLNIQGTLSPGAALTVDGVVTFTNAAQSINSLGNDGGVTAGVVNLDGPTTLTVGSGAFNGAINGLGGLVKNTNGTLTLTNNNSTFAGGVAIQAGTLSVSGGLDGGAPGQLGTSTDPIPLGGGATSGTLQYTGNSVATSRSFTLNPGGGAIEVTTSLQQLTINGTISNGSAPLTLTGSGNGLLTTTLTGSGNLTKTGAGTWTLAGTGSPSGASVITAYDIQAGTLTVTSDGVNSNLGSAAVTLEGGTLGLSSTAAAVFDNAVTFNQSATISAFASTPGGGAVNQSVTVGGTNNVSIATGAVATLTTANGYSLTFAGNVSGGGSVVANGAVNLNGSNNNYAGPTTVNGGTFTVSGALNSAGAITVNNNGTFLANGPVNASAVTLNNTATFNASQPVTITGAVLVNGGTFTTSGALSTSGLTIAGGTYNGNAALTSPGGITVTGGAAIVTVDGGLSNGPISVTGGQLKVDPGVGSTVTYAGPSLANDGLLRAASGTLDLGNLVITTTTPHNATPIPGQLAEAFFTPANAGVADYNSAANGDPLITFDNNNNFLTRKPGATGALTATNLNFTGNAVQGRASGLFGNAATDEEGAVWYGQITVGGPNLPAGPVTFSTNTDDGSTLYVDLNQDGVYEANERVVNNSGSHGVVNVNNTVSLLAGTYNIAIGWYNGTGGLQTDAKFAAGSNIAFASQTFINPGDPGQAGIFSSPATPGSQIQIDGGAQLNAGGFTAADVNFTAGAGVGTLSLASHPTQVVSAADSINMVGSSPGQGEIALGANNTVNVAAINLGINGTLTKSGNGSLVVTGTGTGTGTVAVTGGSLVVSGSLSGAVNVNGGTLAGTGKVGALTLTSGSLAPGIGGPGTLSTSDLTLSGGTLAIEIGGSGPGNYDQLKTVGAVTFGGPVTLTLDFSTYDPVDNTDSFTIVDNDQSDAVGFGDSSSGLYFNGAQLTEGMRFTAVSGAFSQQFQVSYAGGDGNDIVISAIPEPCSLANVLSGLGVLVGLRRFRRR